ncbi:MAG: hypothetical protein RI897_1756 [Verrucomicrobiota bacterium]
MLEEVKKGGLALGGDGFGEGLSLVGGHGLVGSSELGILGDEGGGGHADAGEAYGE